MSKKKLTYRYSKSLNYPANYYGWGSDFANAFKKEFANSREAFAKTFTGANVGNTLANGIGGIGQAIGTTISGDFNTGAGNAISSIGGTIGNIIPGPIGGIVSGVTGVVGGLVNRMFGSTLNNENIAQIEGSNRAISNVLVDNSNYDSILNQWGTQDFGSAFSQSDIGKDGWFSNKAKNKYKQLLKEQGIAKDRALMAYADAINSADTQSDLNLLAQSFAEGGKIYIKPSKRGTFTAAAKKRGMGVQEFASKVLANKEDYSPAMVKKANFARNASKWHAEGGPLEDLVELVNSKDVNFVKRLKDPKRKYIKDWESNGIATHKLSVGTDEFGNDYIFPAVQEINGELVDFTRPPYNSWAGSISAEERGDTVRVNSIEDGLLFTENYKKFYPKGETFAEGGPLQAYGTDWDNGITIIGNGSTHEENPMEGVQIGIDPQGIPNLVEEGEVIFNDYVFSNRLTVPKVVRKKYKLRGNKDITFADAAKQMQKESEERPNDPISKRGLEDSMMRLMASQEEIREEKGVSNNNRFDDGGWTEYLRYAPVAGSIIGLGQNLLSKPDYSNATTIENVAKDMGNYTPVSFDPIDNYLSYNPFDTNFYINKLNAQSGATRRAIMNTSSPSRNAALLAADYNAQGKLGDLARQAEEYNLAQRQQVETFNRATNMANAEMGLKTAMANQDAELKAKNAKLSGIAQAMAMREAIDARRSESMSANMTNLFESLGNIGIDEANRGDVKWLIKSGAIDMSIADIASRFGTSFAREIGKSKGMSSSELDEILGKKSNGGKLRKKRGGFTY